MTGVLTQRYDIDIECITGQKNGKGAIYLGNLEAARCSQTLQKYNIKAVISIAKGGFLEHPQDKLPNYMYVPAVDTKQFDISVYFDKTYDFIDRNRKRTNVLVHCMAGVSRSATIVIAYLMKKCKMEMMGAYSLVKRMRPVIKPNDGFISQLKSFEDKLKTSLSLSKQNHSIILTRNRSHCSVDRAAKMTESDQADDSRIQPINLEEKINAVRVRFGSLSKKGSATDITKGKQQRGWVCIKSGLLKVEKVQAGAMKRQKGTQQNN